MSTEPPILEGGQPEGQPPRPAQPPPPPPVRRRPRTGRGWKIFSLLLFLLLVLSVWGNFSHWVGGLSPVMPSDVWSGRWLREVVLQDNQSQNKIAVIPITGIITGETLGRSARSMVDRVIAQLNRAGEDHRVKAVILRVDSPGGEVLAADDIYRAIDRFEQDSGKPVITSMGSLAASGGYYVSSASRWIVANALTITGSIGVIMHTYNYRNLMEKVGIRPEVFKSGRFKDMLSGEQVQISPEERKMVQDLINQCYARFQKVVADGRHQAYQENHAQGRPLAKDWKQYADGRILSGKEAYKLGFVDELGDFRDAIRRAKLMAHVSTANLVTYRQPQDWLSLFHLMSRSGNATLKVDLGSALPPVKAGHPYYLPSGLGF